MLYQMEGSKLTGGQFVSIPVQFKRKQLLQVEWPKVRAPSSVVRTTFSDKEIESWPEEEH